MPQSKQCAECGATFTRKPHRSHAQWANQTCCTTACANTVRARGRERQLGDLDRSQGKQAYVTEWGRRKAMPRWAAWWEDRRRAEDVLDLQRTLTGGPTCRVSGTPKAREFIAGSCPGCTSTVVVVRGWWHDSIYCSSCTKRRWQGNHRQRAKRYAVAFECIDPTEVFARDGHRCQLCGRKTRGKFPALTSPTVDHIIPMSCGGPHLWHNVQTACFGCNMRKYNHAANDQLRLAV